jgi:hypothetical protein
MQDPHQHQQQQQQHQQQQDIVMDMQVGDPQSALEQQAAIHQHYVSMQQGQPFDALSPSSMSYAPAPELVSNALLNASVGVNPACSSSRISSPLLAADLSFDRTVTSVDPGMISHAPSGAGTPGGVFHLHDIGQQPPFTLDPSKL